MTDGGGEETCLSGGEGWLRLETHGGAPGRTQKLVYPLSSISKSLKTSSWMLKAFPLVGESGSSGVQLFSLANPPFHRQHWIISSYLPETKMSNCHPFFSSFVCLLL